ncbi:MAG: hypothetical protein Q9217_000683 [Psora testacea]
MSSNVLPSKPAEPILCDFTNNVEEAADQAQKVSRNSHMIYIKGHYDPDGSSENPSVDVYFNRAPERDFYLRTTAKDHGTWSGPQDVSPHMPIPRAIKLDLTDRYSIAVGPKMASFATAHNPEPTAVEDEGAARKPYRSYKKKFLKLRHAFREKMRESNTLYYEEQRAKQIARRLQEQNDQLLDLLLDVNDSNNIPSQLRYDLRSPPPDECAVPDLMSDRPPASYQDVQNAQSALQEARLELQSGQIDLQSYKEQEAALSAIIDHGQSLNRLSKTSHSTLQCVPPELIPADLTEDAPTSYLSPAHEDEYLSTIDAYLNTPHQEDQPLPSRSSKPTDREREREIQLRNPMSVYNWLSHHRPKVFLDDDPNHDKPVKLPRRSSPKPPSATPAPVRSNAKREKAGALLSKPEEELLEEDGSVIGGTLEEGGSARKRKRGQEDDAYRPKGGGSRKRKRASTKTSTGGSGESAVRKVEEEGVDT